MSNKRGKFGMGVFLFTFAEMITLVAYLNTGNKLLSLIWALPIITAFAIASLFALDYYLYYREIDMLLEKSRLNKKEAEEK